MANKELCEERGTSWCTDPTDLKTLDFWRVLCLLWVLCFGVCQFTMSGSAYNPWTLQTYFETVAYTLVYSSNLAFDEFFMLSSFFSYLKLSAFFDSRDSVSLNDMLRIFVNRYLRLAPVYYSVFFLGWLLGPFLANGPWWFTYQMGFCNC
jgi:hypothetical protein